MPEKTAAMSIMSGGQGASLTPAGQQCALTTLRKHRPVKSFLVEFLGYGLDEIYEEVGRLQHCLSRRLTESLINHTAGHAPVRPDSVPGVGTAQLWDDDPKPSL